MVTEHLHPQLEELTSSKKLTPTVPSIPQTPLAFTVSEERGPAEAALLRGDCAIALDLFKSFHHNQPQDPLAQLDVARAQLAIGNITDSIDGFKRVISLLRRRQRHDRPSCPPPLPPNDIHNEADTTQTPTISCTYQQLSHVAYVGMGAAYNAQGRKSRAISCYVLALKYLRPPVTSPTPNPVPILCPTHLPPPPSSSGDTVSLDVTSLPPPVTPQDTMSSAPSTTLRPIDAEEALQSLLSTPPAPRASPDRHVQSQSSVPTDVSLVTPYVDIEEALSLHSIKTLQDPFQFSCTMCGECCRTSDNIMLTPLDIFDMSRYRPPSLPYTTLPYPSDPPLPSLPSLYCRSTALDLFGISKTHDLISHDYFKVYILILTCLSLGEVGSGLYRIILFHVYIYHI